MLSQLVGDVHHIHQGEGGEQGDALMPMLFCLGQHGALRAIAERLLPGEKLFAYLDDLYVVCQPDRVGDVHTIVGQELWRHAKISVHHGKTKVWNRGGTCPDACAVLTEAARMVDPRAVVWRGDTSLPRREQGLVILGAPVGQVEFVKAQLEKEAEHSVLLQRIPLVDNLQAAWLLLSFCAAARANFIMRTVSPELGEAFATGHDNSVRACLGSLLNVDVAHVPNFGQMMTNLPLHMGGLGLRSAVRLYPAAHWASWADAVAMVQERHPEVATILVENLTHHTAATSISSVQQCQHRLAGAGFELPMWDRLVEGQRPSASDDDEASWGGWQQRASEKLERDHFSTVRPTLTESE